MGLVTKDKVEWCHQVTHVTLLPSYSMGSFDLKGRKETSLCQFPSAAVSTLQVDGNFRLTTTSSVGENA